MSQVHPFRNKEGFALAIALSLLAFIFLLVISLNVYLRVETGAASMRKDQAEARQNALFGLGVAVGELQRYSGDDRRATAPADILNNRQSGRFDVVRAENRNWTGVYNTANSELLSYLVSGMSGEANGPEGYRPPLDGAGTLLSDESALLVGPASVDLNRDRDGNGLPDDVVVVPKDDLTREGMLVGRYAWWVGDEGVKARFNMIESVSPNTTTPADRKMLATTARANLRVLDGLDSFMADNARLSDIFSLRGMSLIEPGIESHMRTLFHEVTTTSIGLFTNVRDGGLRKDLSLAFEMSDPKFEASPVFGGEESIPFFDAEVAYVFKEDFPGRDGHNPATIRGPTWHLLRNHYLRYQKIENSLEPSIGAQVALPLPNSPYHIERGAGHIWGYDANLTLDPQGASPSDQLYFSQTPRDVVRLVDGSMGPVLTRMEYVFSLRLRPLDPAIDEQPADPSHTHAVDIIWDPVVTVWNPYNVGLEFLGFKLRTRRFPLAFGFETKDDVRIGTTTGNSFTNVKFETLIKGSTGWVNNGMWFCVGNGGEVLHLNPGEVKVFSLGNSAPIFYSDVEGSGKTAQIDAEPGWNFNGGVAIPTGVTGTLDQEMSLRIQDDEHLWLDGVLLTDWDRRFQVPDNDPAQQSLFALGFSRKWGSGWSIVDYVDAPMGAPVSKYSFNFLGGGKIPIAKMSMTLKPMSDVEAIPMAAFANPRAVATNIFKESTLLDSRPAPAWERRLEPLSALPGAVAIGQDDRGFWGPDDASGTSFITMFEIPTAPLTSIGQLMHANIGMRGYDALHAVGNSFASPFVPLNSSVGTWRHAATNHGPYTAYVPDLSYLMNKALWDGYFFSSVVERRQPWFSEAEDIESVLAGLAGGGSVMNERVSFIHNEYESVENVIERLVDGSEIKEDAYARMAGNLMNVGAFNVNSTSIEAWAALLGGLRDSAIVYFDGETKQLFAENDEGSAFGKFTLPNGSKSDAWRGFSRLSDEQIRELAANICEEVRASGPFLSLADFVNRRLENSEKGRGGVIQRAIWATDNLNANPEFTDGANLDWMRSPLKGNMVTSEGGELSTALGMAGYLTQGDILMALGNVLTVRSDTFRVRSYGEVTDPVTGKSKGEVWLEAVVQRVPEPVDRASLDSDDLDYNEPALASRLGRRYKILHIQWLNPDQI